MNELALFAGAGGGILGGHLLGWRTVCAVAWEPYAASILAQRQNDGLLPPFPIWDDVRTFDGRPWRGLVDVVSGGFPCQDISVAGKGAGISGKRSGMWSHMARIIGEVRPRFVFVENSPALLTRGLGVVLSELAALGYDCKWTVLGAADVGAPHKRDRFWLVAHANSVRQLQPERRQRDQRGRPSNCGYEGGDANSARQELAAIDRADWWRAEP
jgi:DNA (cytosine-5)-methyltransferase 1